jgi:hypothetical protein
MPQGYIDSHNFDWASGQTESKLRNMTNRLGINFSEFIDRVDGAITAVNGPNDPLIESLIFRTNEDRVTGGTSSDKVLERSAEYTIPRPQRGKGSGWLLPLYENAITLGFTKKALDVMTVDAFERELATTVKAIRRGNRADVLEALVTDAERPLDNDGTGATPGFIGSGSGSNAYVGTVPPGKTLGSYSLYERLPSTGLEAAVKASFEAWAWFFPGETFELVAPSAGLAVVTAFDGFEGAGSPLIRPAQGTAEALVDPAIYEGALFGQIRVRKAETQMSGTSFTIFRSGGGNSSLNPLAWRYSDIWGPGAWVEDRELYPLANAVVNHNYGVGDYNRAGALNISVAGSGSYTAPTISR